MDTPSTQPGEGMSAEDAGTLIAQRRAERQQKSREQNLLNNDSDDINRGKPAALAGLEAELMDDKQPEVRRMESDADDDSDEIVDQTDAGTDEDSDQDQAEDAQETVAEEDEADEEPQAQDDATEVGDDVRFETIDELAEALEVDVDQFLDDIQITTKVDGVTETVPLSQLKKGYQLEQTANRRLQNLSEEKQKFDSEVEQVRARTGHQFQQAGLVFQMAEQALLQDFQGVNWASLERDDPQQAVLLKQKFGERKQWLDSAVARATAAAEAALQEANQAKEKAQQEKYQTETQRLLERLPNFGQGKDGEKQAKNIAQVLDEVGYGADELNSISDHRLILLANMAIKGAQTSERQNVLKKKLNTLPKLAKPGAKNKRPMSANKKAELNARKKLKRTGSVDDAADLLLARRGIVRR